LVRLVRLECTTCGLEEYKEGVLAFSGKFLKAMPRLQSRGRSGYSLHWGQRVGTLLPLKRYFGEW